MKKYAARGKWVAAAVGAVVLVLATPIAHSELIIGDNFPIAKVKASQIPRESVVDQLLAAYEEDTILLDDDYCEELENRPPTLF